MRGRACMPGFIAYTTHLCPQHRRALCPDFLGVTTGIRPYARCHPLCYLTTTVCLPKIENIQIGGVLGSTFHTSVFQVKSMMDSSIADRGLPQTACSPRATVRCRDRRTRQRLVLLHTCTRAGRPLWESPVAPGTGGLAGAAGWPGAQAGEAGRSM